MIFVTWLLIATLHSDYRGHERAPLKLQRFPTEQSCMEAAGQLRASLMDVQDTVCVKVPREVR